MSMKIAKEIATGLVAGIMFAGMFIVPIVVGFLNL